MGSYFLFLISNPQALRKIESKQVTPGALRTMEKTAAGPKSISHLGKFFLFFQRDLVELGAQNSYYNLARPGGFLGNVFNRPSAVGVVKTLVCCMKDEIAKPTPEFSKKNKKTS